MIDILNPDLRAEYQRKMAQEDYVEYCRRMVRNYDPADHIVHHLVPFLLDAIITPNSRSIITMPPRHSKSLNVSEKIPGFYLGLFPFNRIIAGSHTQSLANTFSRRVRNDIANPNYPFDGVAIADDKGAIQAWDLSYNGQQGGGYYAVGVGGTPTGLGADLIIVDDPIRSAADANSQTVRNSIWEWFTETLYTRLEPGGSIIITATRWHDDDLTGRILKHSDEEWKHLHLPAIDDEGRALWPNRWPLDALARIRSAVGSRAWSAQYQGTPVLDSGSVIKHHWLLPYLVRPHNLHVLQSWDTAYETGSHNDYSVCTTIGYNQYGRYVLDVYREKLEFPDLKRMVNHQYLKWKPQAVLIENAASGRSLIQELGPNRTNVGMDRVPIIPVDVPTIKNWKEVRVQELTPLLEAGRVMIPEEALWLEPWLEELTRFPLAAHDDQVDSLAQALYWLEHRDTISITEGSWLPDVDDDDDDYPYHSDRRLG